MDNKANISKCEVRIDVTPLLGHEKCNGSEFRAMSAQATQELGITTVASLANALLLAVAKTLEEWEGRSQHLEEAVCKVTMAFDQPVSPHTVQAYLIPLESFLSTVVLSSFANAAPLKMTYHYVKSGVSVPWLSSVPLDVD
jgi:hypothetical protein